MPALHRTIREIDAQAWDSLANGNGFASHGWLLTTETSCRAQVEPLYFTLNRDGALIAASVCYGIEASHAIETLDDMLYGRLKGVARAAGLSFLPALVCGTVLGYGWHIGVSPLLGAHEAGEARGLILDAMEAEARSRGVALSFTHVLDEERAVQDLLAARGYLRCRNVPVAVLDVAWNSFDAYLTQLPRKIRKEARRQIKRHLESGSATARSCNIGAEEARLLELLDGNAQKHSALPFAFGPGFFRELERNLDEHAWIFTSRRAGTVHGAAFVLAMEQAVYAVATGVDQEAAGDDFTYFHMTYNTPIAGVIEGGFRRLYFGRGMYGIKRRRGCRLIDNWIYVRASGPARIASAVWFRIASLWNRYKTQTA